MGIALIGWWRARRAGRPGAPARGAAANAAMPAADTRDADLLPYQGTLRALRERSRFSRASFDRDCVGLVKRVMQQPLAGPVRPLLERALRVLALRQAQLLPPGAKPEDIEPSSYRWTFAAFAAAMLVDLRWSDAWQPADLPQAQHDLQRWLAPWMAPQTLRWLCEDEALVLQLGAFFAAPTGPTLFHRLLRDAGRTAPAPTEGAGMPTAPAEAASPAGPPLAPAPPAVPTPASTQTQTQTPTPTPTPAFATGTLTAQSRVAAMATGAAAAGPTVPGPPASTLAAAPPAPVPQAQAAPQAFDARAEAAPPTAAPTELLTGTALASHFMRWVADGLAAGTISINDAAARVHVCADGLVLAAPGLFQDYAAAHASAMYDNLAAFARDVQKAVCEQGWHVRGPQGANLHRFQHGRAGAPDTVVFKGVLFARPERFVADLPAPNVALSRLM
jgi:hypothetical protein